MNLMKILFPVITLLLIATQVLAGIESELYDEDRTGNVSWFGFIYFFGGFWLGLSKKSPCYEWANAHPGISLALFFLVGPIIFNWLNICMYSC
jgi:hypothetical protein